jgi:hypothetical protein
VKARVAGLPSAKTRGAKDAGTKSSGVKIVPGPQQAPLTKSGERVVGREAHHWARAADGEKGRSTNGGRGSSVKRDPSAAGLPSPPAPLIHLDMPWLDLGFGRLARGKASGCFFWRGESWVPRGSFPGKSRGNCAQQTRLVPDNTAQCFDSTLTNINKNHLNNNEISINLNKVDSTSFTGTGRCSTAPT